MALYANLDTSRIERIENDIAVLGHRVDALRVELEEYLSEAPHRFQHNPSRTDYRQPTLYEHVGTLGLNSQLLARTLTKLRAVIERGSDGVV